MILKKLDHDDAVTLTLELYKVLFVMLRCCPSFRTLAHVQLKVAAEHSSYSY